MSDIHPATPMGSLASPATPAMTPGQAPEVERRSECPLHGDGQDHVQLNTHGNWMCVIGLRGLDDGWPEMEERLRRAEDARDKLDADCQQLAATLTRLGNSHADMREALERLADPEPLADPLDGPAEDRTARIAYARQALEG